MSPGDLPSSILSATRKDGGGSGRPTINCAERWMWPLCSTEAVIFFSAGPVEKQTVEDIQKGDVILPYTGQFITSSEMIERQKRNETPYAFKMHNGLIDASCHRGLASHINHNRSSNLKVKQATIVLPRDNRYFKRDAEHPEYYNVLSTPKNAFHSNGWRRVHVEHLDNFRNKSYMHVIATKHIPAGSELFINYNNADALRIKHHTKPSTCKM